MRAANRYALAIIVAHLAVVVLHGAAHHRLDVPLSSSQVVFVAVVVVIAPLVAGILIGVNLHRAGAALLAGSMAGALVFGVWNHFLVLGPDHVSSMPSGTWGIAFQATAVLLAVTETLGCRAGIQLLTTGP